MQWQKGLKKLDAGTTPSEIFNALDELARLPPVSQPTTSASELVGGGQDLLTKVRDCSWPYNIEIEKPELSARKSTLRGGLGINCDRVCMGADAGNYAANWTQLQTTLW